MEGLRGFSKLEVLELYDNSIEYLEDLDVKSDNEEDKNNDGKIGNTLRVLDMSYNVIRDMEPVKSCFKLTELCKYMTLPVLYSHRNIYFS